MKQFFKFTFASMLGFILSGVVLILILFSIIGGIIASASNFDSADMVNVTENSILHLNLNQPISERASDHENPFNNVPGLMVENTIGLNQIKKALKNAATDDKIKGVYIDISIAAAGYATIKEVRDEIIEFKKSGKWVYAYSNVYSQGAYFLASVADKVYLHPQGGMEWKGIYSEVVFLKGLLEKVGVEAQVIRGSNNKFKSAVEPFIATQMSEANKEQVAKYIGVLWDEMKIEIGVSRPNIKNKLEEVAENYSIRSAQKAVDLDFIDATMYRDEFENLLAEKSGTTAKDLNFIKVKKYSKSIGRGKKKDDNATPNYKLDKIAVIYANGGIGDGKGDMNNIGTNIAEAIKEARNDDKVKAIVLRVNSGGGSALMSDIIWRETVLAKAEKPLVVSMGNYAASGGYYISAAADKIYAQPNTITGSIGVFGILPNTKEAMNKHLNVYTDGVETNQYARMGLPTDALTAEEYTIIQSSVDRIYGTFIGIVADGRGVTTEFVDSIGQGRVWAGTDALRLGLVDELGGLDDAIAEAAKMANMEEYKTIDLPKMKDPIEEILSEFGVENVRVNIAKSIAGEQASKAIEQLQLLTNTNKANTYQMRIPFDMEIK
tara:strand:+ start:231446 stop:233263 length:1818 start_codon:yes stop_codon:yes gene_type:complete